MRCKSCNLNMKRLSKGTLMICPCNQPGVQYCNRTCQVKDWTDGGHRNVCDYFAKRKKSQASDLSKVSNKDGVRDKKAKRKGSVKRNMGDRNMGDLAARSSKSADKNHNELRPGVGIGSPALVLSSESRGKVRAARTELAGPGKAGKAGQVRAGGEVQAASSGPGQVRARGGEHAAPDQVGLDRAGGGELASLDQLGLDRTGGGEDAAPGNESPTVMERKLQQKKSTRNYRDFQLAKKRLKAIIDRAKRGGSNWAFKISCQKDSKYSRQKSHCWQSDNYEAVWNSHEKPSTPTQGVARVCYNCKHTIVGPQWSYLVCGGKSCRQGMTHFKCIGFNDISADLAKRMKKEYMCKPCLEKKAEKDNRDADFVTGDVTLPERKKLAKNQSKVVKKTQKNKVQRAQKNVQLTISDDDCPQDKSPPFCPDSDCSDFMT